MLSVYPACFFQEENSYSVVFPDLNGLSTCGNTLNDAMTAAVDCLAGYLYMSKKEGEEIPLPSVMADINISLLAGELEVTVEGAFVNMISVDVDSYAKKYFEKAVKKTLTIPSWLNKAAMEKNITFSQVLQEALLKKIQEEN